MQVLVVVDSLHPGGAERHVVDLAIALHRRGHRVEVACSVAGELEGELTGAGIAVHALMPELVKRRACAEYAVRLGRLVRAGGFDVVHAHVHASEVAAAEATAGTGAALVLTEHTEAPWRAASDRRAVAAACARAEAVLAVSAPVARMLRENLGVADPLVVRPAVTPPPAPAPRGPGGPVVGRVARLQPEKGLDVLLRAAVLVRAELPAARFVVVGDGPLAGPLRTLAAELDLDEAVAFLGHRPDARRLLPTFDVMAVTSRSEGSPLVVSEALAAGVPVVAAAVGGVPDQFRDGVEGLLVPPDRPDDLAAALLQLLRRPALRARMGRAARRRASAWPHERMVDAVEAVYLDAVPVRAASGLELTG